MAKKLPQLPNIGDLVYEVGAIMKPGKVIAISVLPDLYGNYTAEVKWLNGSTTFLRSNYLNDFNHATDEHLRKYQKFEALRLKLKTL